MKFTRGKSGRSTSQLRLIAIGSAAFLPVIVIFLWSQTEREPEYKARPLSSWLEHFGRGSAPDEALSAMGTNAVPFLLRKIRTKPTDSPVKQRLAALLSRQSIIRYRYIPGQTRQRIAGQGLAALGPRAEGAIPELSKLAKTPEYTLGATCALSGIGPKAVPPLLHALTNENPYVRACATRALGSGFECRRIRHEVQAVGRLGENYDQAIDALMLRADDSEPSVREAASSALGQIARKPEKVVPFLVQKLQQKACRVNALHALSGYRWSAVDAIPDLLECLDDTNTNFQAETLQTISQIAGHLEKAMLIREVRIGNVATRTAAALSLGNYGRDAGLALPALLECLRSTDAALRAAAMSTIGTIAENPTTVVPALIRALSDPDTHCRKEAAKALRDYGSQSRAAIPFLQILSNDVDADVSRYAMQALRAIDE